MNPSLEPFENAEANHVDWAAHILLVGASPNEAAWLDSQLTQQGYCVSAAPTAEEAWDIVHSLRPQLVLISEPLMEGDALELCGQISDDELLGGTPVILLGGFSSERSCRKARAAGCRYFFSKPFDPNLLLLAVDDAVRSQQPWSFESE